MDTYIINKWINKYVNDQATYVQLLFYIMYVYMYIYIYTYIYIVMYVYICFIYAYNIYIYIFGRSDVGGSGGQTIGRTDGREGGPAGLVTFWHGDQFRNLPLSRINECLPYVYICRCICTHVYIWLHAT